MSKLSYVSRTQKTEQLQKDLACCPSILGKEREWVYVYLVSKGIHTLGRVDVSEEMEYRKFTMETGKISHEKKAFYAGALESCMLCYLSELPEFQTIIQEVNQSVKLARPIRNKVLHFLLLHSIKKLDEITYPVRQMFEQYLNDTGCAKKQEYLKALDCLKLCTIAEQNQNMPFGIPKLVFQETPVFLLYHPDYHTAMEFYYLRDKEEAVFDFSIPAARKLKKQIFSMLNYALARKTSRKNRRELYLVPLKKLYLYCAAAGIEDIEKLEEEQIAGFRSSMEGKVGTKTQIYMQIVDNTRRFLFLQAKETNWDANVWYLKRFHLKGDRMNPASLVLSFRFYRIRDQDNRKLLQEYMRYCIGISSRTISSIRRGFYNVDEFMRYCDAQRIKVEEITKEEIERYLHAIDRKGCLPETFNKKTADLHRFYQFLVAKGYCRCVPFHLRYYLKETYPVHHTRIVPENTQKDMLQHLKNFPEDLRLMYLHLWCLGLRVNEVCCIRGDAYSWNGSDAWIHVYQYKTHTEKMIPMPTFLYLQMQAYIGKNKIRPDSFVFPGERKGGAYCAATFCVKVKQLCSQYGIHCENYLFRSHDYRHTVGTRLYQGGASIQAVRDYLGHLHDNMTRQYLDCIPEAIDEANSRYFRSQKSLKVPLQERNQGNEPYLYPGSGMWEKSR